LNLELLNLMNIQKIRQETQGVEFVKHFNNAGASLMPNAVYEMTTQYLKEELLYGGYETLEKYAPQFKAIYPQIAQLIGAKPEEIGLVQSATVAWAKAFWAIPLQDGDKILVSKADYVSNYLGYLQLQKRKKVEIVLIPDDEFGQTSPQALEKLIDKNVKLISITHIPSGGGLVNPVADIGKIAQKHGIIYLLDACQSIGHFPVDVQEIGCDILSATGRKYLRAPRGTGFVYVNQKLLAQKDFEPIMIDARSATWIDEANYAMNLSAICFETFENFAAGQLGLGKAVEYALELGIENIWTRIQYVGRYLREKLEDLDHVVLHDLGKVKSGIVTFSIKNKDSLFVKEALKAHQINISLAPQQSTLLDMKARHLDNIPRASVHYFNTEEEIDAMIAVLKDM
jgi:cysteine desulfurase / selenocysteine lyase